MSEQKKSTSKIALIIGSIVVIAIIVVALIMVLGGNSNQTPNHTHTYDEWKTVKDATCSQEGTKERYCSCGEKQTSSIAKSEHTYGEWLTVTESTCKQAGVKKRTCSACSHEETGSLALSTTHNYGEWTETTPAKCNSTGTKTRTCSVCNKSEKGTIEKIDHNVNASTGKCQDCGAQISNPQITLTTTNIYEYLSFVAGVENVNITNDGRMERGDGNVRVNATKLKNVTFHDVVLVITLKTSSRGWGTMQNREIVVPFDGNINSLFYIIASDDSKVSKTPNYQVEVQSVTGYVTFN